MQESASQSAQSGWAQIGRAHLHDFNQRNTKWLEEIVRTLDTNEYKAKQEQFAKAQDKFLAKQKAQYMKKQNIEGLHSFDITSTLGKAYIADMNFCLEYALLNRKHMINSIASGILEQQEGWKGHKRVQFINRNHNHADIQGNIVIHRKGATHAEDGMLGVIPGNMKDGSFIVKGKGNSESMSSSSHGAGRVLSRRKAKEQLSLDTFHEHMTGITTNHTDANLDESPDAYKSIFEVMELQKDLVEVIDHIKPILNIKG